MKGHSARIDVSGRLAALLSVPARRASAIALALGLFLFLAPVARADFGIEPGSLKTSFLADEGGLPETQASAHPYAFKLAFNLNRDDEGRSVGGEMRDVLVDLPQGLSGNPFAIPRCTRQEFEGQTPKCPPNTQVGVVKASIPGFAIGTGAVYNMVPPPGVAAQIGFSVTGLNSLQNISLRTDVPSLDERYGLHVANTGIPVEVTAIEFTLWGTPADSSHDKQRGQKSLEAGGGEIPYIGPHLPFLVMPAQCSAPLKTTVYVDSKLNPGNFVKAEAQSLDSGGQPAPLQGCDDVPFSPSVFSTATSTQAQGASGFDFEFRVPNEGLLNPEGISETQASKIEVGLPTGITANPSAADGLVGCTTAQFAAASPTDQGCPEASKLGTLVAHTPLLEEAVEGGVYLAKPLENQFGGLLSLYLVVSAPQRGVLIKQAGRVDINQATGQLTTTFDGLPPLPYSSFELDLRGGPRAPLTTPLACGSYQTTAKLYPFSNPGVATVKTAPFTISSGPEGDGCVGSEAQLANAPTFEAGTQTPLAGAFSPFVLRLARSEASQRFSGLNLTLPPGMTAKFAGRAECSDAQIAQAASRSREGEGALEQASPSCPAGSELGTVTVGAGSGTPLYVTGHAYLGGPYKGAPFSIVAITPAIAGPFDLGVVVVRSALYVNEETAQGTVRTDPIPTILHGIPLDVRSIAINVDRGDFTLNPTSCEAKRITGEAISTVGAVAPLQNRFQVGGCRGLEFHPQLKIQLKGATGRLGHPALKAVLTAAPGEANIARAQVNLPHGEFLDQGNLNKTCTRPVLLAGACPASSVYGHAKAWTPLLDKPLAGPVYLVGGYGYKLPALVAELNGQVRLLLVGKVDSGKNKGIRNTFEVVPDAPVSRFELRMKGGKRYGLLENSENLCTAKKARRRAIVRFQAHNNRVYKSKPTIHNQCAKHRSKSHARHSRRH